MMRTDSPGRERGSTSDGARDITTLSTTHLVLQLGRARPPRMRQSAGA
jgi:hypothetical protein